MNRKTASCILICYFLDECSRCSHVQMCNFRDQRSWAYGCAQAWSLALPLLVKMLSASHLPSSCTPSHSGLCDLFSLQFHPRHIVSDYHWLHAHSKNQVTQPSPGPQGTRPQPAGLRWEFKLSSFEAGNPSQKLKLGSEGSLRKKAD